MSLTVARVLAGCLEWYAAAGAVVAVVLLAGQVDRLDPMLARSPLAVRLLLFPGMVALWPIFARRRLLGRSIPAERTAHRDRAGASDPGGRP